MHPVLQSESSECALASLAMVANAHGLRVDLFDLRRKFPVSLKGATLEQLISHAGALNFSSRPLRLEMHELAQLALPCILNWDLNHFVVLKKVGRGHITVLDPAVGERRLPLAEVSPHFTGVVLELFAIAAPLLNQLVVDDAIATHDADILKGIMCLHSEGGAVAGGEGYYGDVNYLDSSSGAASWTSSSSGSNYNFSSGGQSSGDQSASLGCDMAGAAVSGALSPKFGGFVGNIAGTLTTGMCNQLTGG